MSNATLKKPFFTYGNDIPTYIPTSVIKSAKILASKCIAYFDVVILTLTLHSSEKST